MGVNNLAERFFDKADPNDASKWAYSNAGMALLSVARTAWHPASQPPTVEDSWDGEYVIVFDPKTNEIGTTTLDSIWCGDIQTGYWARIRDVVLLPFYLVENNNRREV